MTENTETSTLVYDGDCGICREWVDYWRQLTGNKVTYRPYQEAAADYPGISEEEFRHSIYLFEEGGSVYSGAHAAFRLYKGIAPHATLGVLYRNVPGIGAFSEACYNFFSRRRSLLAWLTHLSWGRHREPARYQLVSLLFLRLLGCIYLAAFISLRLQITGLVGVDGILPLGYYLTAVADKLGTAAWWHMPTLFWLNHSDGFLQFACWLGAILSLLVIINRYTTVALIGMYMLYLSLYYAGQVFLSFQWDLLLLEAGFLAIFLGTGSRVIIWLYRWLVFRFMFMGGLVKVLSGDPSWSQLTALHFYFETQPLPTPVAWYAHHLPVPVLTAGTALTLFTELIIPFLIFLPRRLRITAAYLFITFQSLILLTGNYCWFNLLTICLCLFLMDDAHIRWLTPGWLAGRLPVREGWKRVGWKDAPLILLAAVLFFVSVDQMATLFRPQDEKHLTRISTFLEPLHLANIYGPFAVMTTLREEIIIEGSADGQNWRPYEFKYKPGDVARAPGYVIPHQPRLDWQMWFAALSSPGRNPWFQNLLIRLLQNKTAVTDLLQTNPFPDQPPHAVRALYYEYHFTTAKERRASGNWWKRSLTGEYYPAITLWEGSED